MWTIIRRLMSYSIRIIRTIIVVNSIMYFNNMVFINHYVRMMSKSTLVSNIMGYKNGLNEGHIVV